MLFKRRSADGFNLAFLDVMACGLGAIVLILMLVKFNASTDVPSNEIERLQQELNALENNAVALQATIAQTSKAISAQSASLAKSKQRVTQLTQQKSTEQQALINKKAVLADVEKSIAAAAPMQADDNASLQGVGEETYLLGLKVEGKNIGILIDTSASMTDEKLIEIIRRKIGSDAKKQSAPKWRRTKRVVQWLLARVPTSSQVSVVSFNSTASKVGSKSIVAANNRNAMKQNGTNLQIGLSEIRTLNPKISHLYIITDGLPTLGKRSKSLRSLASCASLFSNAKTITGECRLRLFFYSLQQVKMSGIQVNVILLPLEGDPQAPQAYWEWTASTGGLLISPAASWP
jgi:hypothetical protein